MAKPLRAIIGVKPEPKPHKTDVERSPNVGTPGVADKEKAWIDQNEKGTTVVPDVQGNDNDTSKIAKAKEEGPDVGLKQKLGV